LLELIYQIENLLLLQHIKHVTNRHEPFLFRVLYAQLHMFWKLFQR